MRAPHWALLNALRVGRGMSITELGERMGVVRSQASRYDNGQVDNPEWATVVRWAQALDVSLDLVAYFGTHEDLTDDIAVKAARLMLAGHTEAEIIATLNRRYEAQG